MSKSMTNKKMSEKRSISFCDIKLKINDGLMIERFDEGGIQLPEQMFWELLQHIDEIDAAFQDIMSGKENVKYTCHLGDNFKVYLRDPYWVLHISRWIDNKKEQGISLKRKEWKIIRQFLKKQDLPQFDNYTPCYYSHDNQMSSLTCKTCNPNTYHKWW